MPDRSAAVLKRLRYTLFVSQLLFLAAALNAFLFQDSFIVQHNMPGIFGIRLDVFVWCLAALLVLPIFSILREGKFERAIVCYCWLLSIVGAATAMLEGGLESVPVMGFPIVAIFSALYTERRVFLPICAFLCIMVILMGFNHHYGWFQGVMSTGSARVFDCLLLVLISTYVAWILGSENKQSMAALKQEHQRVVESQTLIRKLADTDPLTGLLNRNAARDRFDSMQAGMVNDEEALGLYFIDLDNFKNINDLFDHQIGDELLITVSTRLSSLVDKDTVVCRLGGDEFVIFFKSRKSFDYDALATKILQSLSAPHQVLRTSAEITASVGIAVINDRQISFDDARKNADMAMNKAKHSGKNAYHHYSKRLHHEYMRNITILDALKDALSQNLLDLHFQPKVSLDNGQIVGAEALIRWLRSNPDRLTPNEFIPVIESTKLIHDIGAWVLNRACRACKKWHALGHEISVAVNVSAMQLAHSDFHSVVVNALKEHKLHPGFLELEITEYFLLQENTEIQGQLAMLKQLGVVLAIDDFGTGYSNMSYLTRMEVDVLKLDRSFISQIESSADALVIVTAIIEMANVLGMTVVAEGVEKESERDLLRTLGCGIGQGYFWSKALPEGDLLEYLNLRDKVLEA